jgi:flavodoxin
VSTSIVYYSHHGNNETLANHLSERIGCVVQPIVEVRKRTGFTILLDLLFGRLPRIQPLHAALDESDHVILISPVWGGRVAAPLRSFLRLYGQQLRDYSFITLCGYENQGQAAALSAELARRVGRLPRALAELRVSDLVPLSMRRNLRVINAYRVQDAELARYQAAIDEFLRAALEPPPSVVDERKERPLQASI